MIDTMGKKQLLITCHTPTANTKKLASDCVLGAKSDNPQINILYKNAVETRAEDVLMSDGIIIGTTENIGYMGGLTKDFFDRIYYPVLEKKQGMPVACFIRAGLDGTGSSRAIESIITGLKWQWVQPIMLLKGNWQDGFATEVSDLGNAMAIGIEMGVF